MGKVSSRLIMIIKKYSWWKKFSSSFYIFVILLPSYRYDPHATQFISFSVMSDFIASLDPPLGIPKPNLLALVSFDLPIAKGEKIHCLDVLHSLTKYTLGFVDDGSEDFGKVSILYLFSFLMNINQANKWKNVKMFCRF